jgi:PilZ domain-containing protein
MSALRDGLRLSGRVLRFASTTLATAFESVRSNQPGLVALDAMFAETLEGRAFIDRVDKLAIPGSDIRLVAKVGAAWATTPLVRAGKAAPLDVKAAGLNTRRAPRFLVLDPLKAVVESTNADLVDLSVLGAQVVSTPVLRPNQKIRVALPDGEGTLRVSAHVAWSLYEKPRHATDAYYRAGMEFTDAAKEALEDFCHRHCWEDPLPYRGGAAR